MATFYTAEEAEQAWTGLGVPDRRQLEELLAVSRAEVLAFAPVTDEADIPAGHRWAHLQHAKNLWNAQNVNPAGTIGDDAQSFAVTPYPLDWAIKQRLRPRVIFGGVVG